MKRHLVVSFLLFVSMVECDRILVSAPFGSKSHQNTYVPLIKALAERGHHVTLITNYAVKDLQPFANIEQVELDALKIDNSMFGDAFKKAMDDGGSLYERINMMVGMLTKLDMMSVNVAEVMYTHPQVLRLIESASFDLVLMSQFFSSSSYPLAWHFNATMAMYSPAVLFPGIAPVLGGSDHTEYVPNALMELTNQMTLPQRVINTVSLFFFDQFFTQRHKTPVRSVAQTVLPNCPPLDDIEKEMSLVFYNSHPIFHYTRTMTPEMIEIGGIHCKPATPLAPTFEDFVGNHDAGFVLFAVGSAIQMNDMPADMLNSFIAVFQNLPQRVIWQWGGPKRSDLGDNIMAIDWFPQQDLLGHKNCRLFLTHGGLNSLMEAVYHGVPVLGMPFGTDQNSNLARSLLEGYSLTLNWKDIDQESLSNTIGEMLNNPKYSETADRLSELMRDQPQSPLDRAVYWTEFNLRHNGAKHLRLGSRYLSGYQRALIDVYGVILALILLPIVLVVLMVRKCCRPKKTKRALDKKKQ